MQERFLICPKCHIPMVREMKGALEADVCPQCGGMFLSREAWQMAKEDWELALELEKAYEDTNPMPILVLEMFCPNCQILMEQFFLPEAPNLPVELCVQCGSLWFDDGELGKLIETIRLRQPRTTMPLESEEKSQVVEKVYCAHCGRENFFDSERCWACGEILIPERTPLPPTLQIAAEVLSMMIGGAGAILFGFFVTKPQGDKWAALGLLMLVIGLLSLAVLRRLWRRGRGTPLFPTYSGH
ncbi:MAG: zf-TFIIB domain-containing protein [Armatimonadetes bacterium]|nr:zf-TFIIB domain-containing protein [Armatimonadota bacterium]